jgi:hypothetical protein
MFVHDPRGNGVDMHLSQVLIDDPRGSLTMLFRHTDGHWRVVEALIGPYAD